jgi:hypothetical protein
MVIPWVQLIKKRASLLRVKPVFSEAYQEGGRRPPEDIVAVFDWTDWIKSQASR